MDVPRRDRGRRICGGVCASLAEYFGADPAITRLLFVLWAFASRSALAVYALLWILLPAQGEESRSLRERLPAVIEEIRAEARALAWGLRRSLNKSMNREPRDKRALAVSVLLIAMGLLWVAEHLALWDWYRLGQLWPVVLALAGVVMSSRAVNR